jgi:hypothetical protein
VQKQGDKKRKEIHKISSMKAKKRRGKEKRNLKKADRGKETNPQYLFLIIFITSGGVFAGLIFKSENGSELEVLERSNLPDGRDKK